MTAGAVPNTSSPSRGVSLWWRRPPGRLFHLLLVPLALIWLWSWSVPGLNFLLWIPSVWALGVGALVWGVRLLTYVVASVRGEPTSGGRWFLLAPACGVLALGLVIADVPLKARWAISRADFEEVVDEALADDDHRSVEHRRLGLYIITLVYRQRDAVIFYELTGALSHDAGFAYLPDGPFPELEDGSFERPQFRHLSGPWYAWTASW